MKGLVVLVLCASLLDPGHAPRAAAYDVDNGADPPISLSYRYYSSTSWQYFDEDFADPDNTAGIYRSRTYDARQEWNNRNEAGVSITFIDSSTNHVGWKYIDAAGSATQNCDGDGCVLHLDRQRWWDDRWWPYLAEPPASMGYVPGVLVHEFGHWLGLGHGAIDGCQIAGGVDALYAPPPTNAILTMCFDRDEPGVDAVDQRTVTQDEIQGLNDIFLNRIEANNTFEDCCWTTYTPNFWMTTSGANKWRGSGIVSLNDNATVPYPELFQQAWGNDVDGDNDGIFRITFRARAIHDTVLPRLVAFVRSVNFGGEVKCDKLPQGWPVGTWKTFTCDLDMTSSTVKLEFGVRVTEKFEIDYIRITDL